MPADLVLFNQICLLVHWKSKRKATWLMPLHQTCQLTLWSFIRQDCYIVNTTHMPAGLVPLNVESCYVAASTTYMSAGPNTAAVQSSLLVECCCKMDACWTVATQSACLLTVCFSILHVCWCCASLSAIPSGRVSQHQLCLLLWCLTISRAGWHGA